jgi:hypothetical protein
MTVEERLASAHVPFATLQNLGAASELHTMHSQTLPSNAPENNIIIVTLKKRRVFREWQWARLISFMRLAFAEPLYVDEHAILSDNTITANTITASIVAANPPAP